MKRVTLIVGGGIILLRLIMVFSMGLMPQDAYYSFYASNLSLSYFDHPPMVAWMLKVGTSLFGHHIWALKLTDFLVTSLFLVSFRVLAGRFLSRERANLALVLMGTTVLCTILSVITTPDVPLMLFWTLALLALHDAIYRKKLISWAWAGIFMGLSFDSKYTALVLPVGMFAFLLFSPSHRRMLLKPGPWLALFISSVCIIPVLIWNMQNDWASLAFQSTRRANEISGFNPIKFLGLIGTQLFLVFPFVLFLLFKLSWKYGKKFFKIKCHFPGKIWFLLLFSLPLVVGFTALGMIYWVKINWIMPAYIAGIILVVMFFPQKWIRWHIGFAGVLTLLFFVEVIGYPLPVRSDDTWYGWEELATEVDSIQVDYPKAFVFSRDGYKTTAILDFLRNRKIYGRNIVAEPALHFDFVGDDLNILTGKDAIFIDSEKRFKDLKKLGHVPKAVKPFFESYKELKPILIKKDGVVVRKFFVFHCTGYKGLSKK